MSVGTTHNKVNRVVAFGDSWAYGSELKPGELPFVHWVADALECPYRNFGVEGSSLAMIAKAVVDRFSSITKNSLVLVVIPPDVRWYSETEEKGFYTIKDWNEYLRVAGDYSTEWFTYHHALFIYTIQNLLKDIGCPYIMMHNYGTLERLETYKFPIDSTKFLHTLSLTSLLSGATVDWEPLFHDPKAELFTGKYFEGCIHHPNEFGHKRIAELILEKYNAG